jgi:hypothetical protein
MPLQMTTEGKYTTFSVNDHAFIVGICNKKPQGGGLLQEFEKRAKGKTMIIARCAEFPTSARSQVSVYIGELIARGGRRAQVEDTDWQTLMAFPEFYSKYASDPCFSEWQKEMRPLTRFPSVQKILGVEDVTGQLKLLPEQRPSVPEPPTKPRVKPEEQVASAAEAHSTDSIDTQKRDIKDITKRTTVLVGTTDSRDPQPVLIDPREFTRHAAFLGGSGSGKSTLAMSVIEQLLLDETPVVLVDRKGDLASYASSSAWKTPAPVSELEARRGELEKSVDIALYLYTRPSPRPAACPFYRARRNTLVAIFRAGAYRRFRCRSAG